MESMQLLSSKSNFGVPNLTARLKLGSRSEEIHKVRCSAHEKGELFYRMGKAKDGSSL